MMGFLERDPRNARLLADAAQAAFEERKFALVSELLVRHAEIAALPPPLLNLLALAALAEERFADAAAILERLRSSGHDNPQVRFNIAWAYWMMQRYEEAELALDDGAIAASPKGPALKILLLHHLERYDDALAAGADMAARHPHDEALMGALANLAMDADRIALAQDYAMRSGDNPEGLAARGMFALDDGDHGSALSLFDRSLGRSPGNARAWVGKGLALLGTGDPREAAAAIERGAALFEGHLGSWVAAGWAYFISGDLGQARTTFDHVVALDPAFSEGHGGLAVLDAIEGKSESAHQSSRVALRLDRNSMGGALAQSLLMDARGESEAAERIRATALAHPIGPGGRTLAQVLSTLGSNLFR